MERTTLADVEVLLSAVQYRKADEELQAALTAWYTVQAGATDKKGRPIYQKFSQLFNYEKRLKEIENGTKAKDPKEERLVKEQNKILHRFKEFNNR